MKLLSSKQYRPLSNLLKSWLYLLYIFMQALGCDVFYGTDIDWDSKLTKFRPNCITIHRYLKNKRRMKFYKTVAVPIFLYASETWTLGKRNGRAED